MNGGGEKYAGAQMLIRKPAAEVFEAFTDPDITKHFWFTRGSGKLEAGRKVTWEWEMYQFSTEVTAKEMIPGKRILLEWGEPAKTVEFLFESRESRSTYVTIKEWGYHKSGDPLLAAIRDSTGGFTTVLDGLKAFLEHGINLNLISDKFPPLR